MLEHCDNPYLELKELYRSMKKGSKICIAVPCDNIKTNFQKMIPTNTYTHGLQIIWGIYYQLVDLK